MTSRRTIPLMTKEEVKDAELVASDWRGLRSTLAEVQRAFLGKRVMRVEITTELVDHFIGIGKIPKLTVTAEDGTKLYFYLTSDYRIVVNR